MLLGLEFGELAALCIVLGVVVAVVVRAVQSNGDTETKKALNAQNETISALESRVALLESDLKDALEALRDEKVARRAIEEANVRLVEAVAESNVCANAPACPTRVLPGGAQ